MHSSTSPVLAATSAWSRWLPIAAAGILACLVAACAGPGAAAGKPGPANRLAGRPAPTCCCTPITRSTGIPGGPRRSRRRRPRTSRSSCRSATARATGATSWSARASWTPRSPGSSTSTSCASRSIARNGRTSTRSTWPRSRRSAPAAGRCRCSCLPDGRPFYGGTYLPPRDRQGVSGFLTVLSGIAKAWREERGRDREGGRGLTEIVRRKLGSPSTGARPPLTRDLAAEGRAQLAEQFDPEYGGFGYNPQNARGPSSPSR